MLKVLKRNIDLELLKLVRSPGWPYAVNPNELCPPDSELEKSRRAEGVIEVMIEKSIKNCRVLDIGCGEGHTTFEFANQGAKIAVGYDIIQQGSLQWDHQEPNKILTTSWDAVEKNAPYDIILIHDVIDHMESEEVALDVMTKAYALTNPQARAFVRCHPWISRHGGHLYNVLNKAWIHLLLRKEELEYLIPEYTQPHVLRLTNPTETYDRIFSEAGWTIRYQTKLPGYVEGIFHNDPTVIQRLKDTLGAPRYMMIINPFVDYVLMRT